MKLINLTGHHIMMNNGTVYPPSGSVIRVTIDREEILGYPFPCVEIRYNGVDQIPPPQEGVMYIVSTMTFDATDRTDVVCPDTTHPLTIRDEKYKPISVPCFRVRLPKKQATWDEFPYE
jgi:hypothetical protein